MSSSAPSALHRGAGMARRIAGFARFVIRQTRGQAILALVFLLLGSVTESISILLLIPLLQIIGPGAGAAPAVKLPLIGDLLGGVRIELVPLLLGFVALIIAQALFTRFKALYMAETMQVAVDRLRLTLFRNIGMARWTLIARTRGSDLNHALTVDVDRVQTATYNLLMLIQNVIMLIVYGIVAAMVSIRMTLFAMLVGGVVLVALFPVRRHASLHGVSLTRSLQERHRTFSEFLSGIKMAKAFNAEPSYFAQLSRSLDRVRADTLRFARLSNTSTIAFQVTSAIAAAIFIYVAFARLALPLPRIGAMLFLFLRVTPRFNAIQDSAQLLMSQLPAYESVRAMVDRFERERESRWGEEAREMAPLERRIRFEGVSMRFAGDPPIQVLHDASFRIPAGRITAVIGPSGSGKSTIADLVMGLLEPTAGVITVDDVPLDEDNRRGWRDQIAYVPQDVFLLHDSIAANLSVGAPDADAQAMWDALEAANARDFVQRLPEKLETVVGDRGVRLSGGERQRIALARGLLRRPRLLILDEATSALDWENQSMIARSIERLRGTMTIVTIAHRPSMISFADWVITVEDGRIIETGDYADLIGRADSRLRRLVVGEQVLGHD